MAAKEKKPSRDLLQEMRLFRKNQARHIKELLNYRQGTRDPGEKEFCNRMIHRLTEQLLEEDYIVREFKAKGRI